MLQPPSFRQDSIATSLGTIVYYTADRTTPLAASMPEDQSSQSQPSIVFLHGFGGGSSAYEWSKVYPAFVPEYRVVAPDLLGWGRSNHLTRPYQIEDYLTTIREFLEQVSSTPAIVVASSLTAAFVVRVAVNHPRLMRSLILSAPTGLADFGQPYENPLAQIVSIPGVDRLLYSTAIANPLGIRTFLEQRQFAQANRVSPEIVDAYLASALQPNAEYSALSFVRGDLCFDLAQYFPDLSVPTAILWGRQAQLSSPSLAQRFAELNPRAIKAVEILEGVGLTPQLELPAVTIGVIRQFLAEL
ncbi:alpha/beta fold hydrolase [Leptolyngbya ohadii]|uniref:alpha/beta fold hydrolase n=1 Tax=Leptolyngbya ohadii TaxID=1962290 RepID=UPI000B5A1CBD|nr:alpha/beta hydrolase [Leptolyngbya ohadii]